MLKSTMNIKIEENRTEENHSGVALLRRRSLGSVASNAQVATRHEASAHRRSIASGILAVFALAALTSSAAQAAEYRFTRIADESGPLRFNGSPAAMNDAGEVTFAANTIAGSGIFVVRGGPVETVADNSDGFPFFGFSAIQGRGEVSFFGFRTDGTGGFYSGAHGETTLIDDSGPILGFAGDCHSSRSGAFTTMHAFLKDGGQRIFAARNRTISVIADTSAEFSGFDTDPSVNASGQVAFQAELRSGGSGLFVSNGEKITTIADTSGSFAKFTGASSINNRGEVAFGAILKSDKGPFFRPDGIFVGSGGDIRTVVDSNGPFMVDLAFGHPVINDKGQVAFFGTLDNSKTGLFVGPDPIADRVILIDDPLDGSTVVNISVFRDYFNNTGQLVFTALLADGRTEIIRADPVDGEPGF
jgi:hypothetical protein